MKLFGARHQLLENIELKKKKKKKNNGSSKFRRFIVVALSKSPFIDFQWPVIAIFGLEIEKHRSVLFVEIARRSTMLSHLILITANEMTTKHWIIASRQADCLSVIINITHFIESIIAFEISVISLSLSRSSFASAVSLVRSLANSKTFYQIIE